jgi:hypothetical protein
LLLLMGRLLEKGRAGELGNLAADGEGNLAEEEEGTAAVLGNLLAEEEGTAAVLGNSVMEEDRAAEFGTGVAKSRRQNLPKQICLDFPP